MTAGSWYIAVKARTHSSNGHYVHYTESVLLLAGEVSAISPKTRLPTRCSCIAACPALPHYLAPHLSPDDSETAVCCVGVGASLAPRLAAPRLVALNTKSCTSFAAVQTQNALVSRRALPLLATNRGASEHGSEGISQTRTTNKYIVARFPIYSGVLRHVSTYGNNVAWLRRPPVFTGCGLYDGLATLYCTSSPTFVALVLVLQLCIIIGTSDPLVLVHTRYST